MLRRSSCGFARTEPMVCCSSQLLVKEEEEIEDRVVIQRVGGNSLSGTSTRRVGDAGASDAVRFGGTASSTEVTRVETSRRAGEEEFSRRNGFGEESGEEVYSGEDWGGVSSIEEEDHHDHGDDGEDWRGGEGGESWDGSDEYEGEDWGVQSLGTKCITAFDCV